MVLITRKIEFSASQPLPQPKFLGGRESPHLWEVQQSHGHGHNYTLEVTVAGEPDPVTGMVLDLKELKEILEREVMQRMDHRHLNYEVPELAGQIPTCENIAQVLWRLLDPRLHAADCTTCACTNRRTFSPIVIATVRLRQGSNEQCLKLELGRRYRFSASHRLHTAHLTEEENNRIFGKCNILTATAIITSSKSASQETLTQPRV